MTFLDTITNVCFRNLLPRCVLFPALHSDIHRQSLVSRTEHREALSSAHRSRKLSNIRGLQSVFVFQRSRKEHVSPGQKVLSVGLYTSLFRTHADWYYIYLYLFIYWWGRGWGGGGGGEDAISREINNATHKS